MTDRAEPPLAGASADPEAPSSGAALGGEGATALGGARPVPGTPGGPGPSDAPTTGTPAHPAGAQGGPFDARPSEREGDDQGYSDLNRAYGRQVHNHFHAAVDASGAVFGMGAVRAPGLAPGLVRDEDVERALLHYVSPEPCFTDALATLDRDHLVVLTGPEDSGRRAGAFALLRQVAGRGTSVRSLSPADSLATLAAGGYLKERRAFVILDYLGETNADAVQSYDMGRLAEELRRKHSYLVITATEGSRRRLAFKNYYVPWQAPVPLDVFRHVTGVPAQDESGPRLPEDLLERVTEQRRPADVAAAAAGFRTGGAEAAMRVLHSGEAEAVDAWFARQPSLDDLLPMATLVFLEGLPERTFEEHLAGLVRAVREYELTGEAGPGEGEPAPAAGAGRAAFRQSRTRWNEDAAPLARVERSAAPGQGDERRERRPYFTSPAVRDLVAAELHERYGYELWNPLRNWLNDLSHNPDLGVRSEVARGVALLAGHALTDVDDWILQSWAAGPANQRVTTALTLQYMAETDRLASAALNVALGWASNRGQARAITMAMALAGELGSLYRFDVLNRLWHLTGRGDRLTVAARKSLVLLAQTAEQDPDRARLTLRYLRTKIAETRRGTHEQARVLETARQVLDAPRLDDQPGTLAGVLIQSDPGVAEQVGRLWAQLMLGRSRRAAVDALCRTLFAVRDQPPATDAVRILGEAMRDEMTPAHWEALRSRLMAALRRPYLDNPGAHMLVRILLGVLRADTLTPGPKSLRRSQGERAK